jgi:hypothetical protein
MFVMKQVAEFDRRAKAAEKLRIQSTAPELNTARGISPSVG